MSIKNWNAGIIRPVAVAPAGPLATGAAPGVWTLDQQAFWQKQGLWPIAGNNLYIEDVFSTYLYTGTGASQTITNGIDLSTKGGLVWIKRRDAAGNNNLADTARPGSAANSKMLFSNSINAENTGGFVDYVSYNSTGFTANLVSGGGAITTSGWTFASWTFRKQAKFFDVVTYTGTGANRTVAHNLGSVPGCIIVKATSTTGDWITYHRSLGNTDFVRLNTTGATAADNGAWNNTSPTSTEFSLGTGNTNVNGVSYVAYLFAHDAGGFGAAGTDNVISCGAFTTDGSGNATVTLGYEPQWVLLKGNSAGQPWILVDQMRKLTVNSSSNVAELYPNATSAEVNAGGISPNSTGFTANAQLTPSIQYIYIAIRRGPMKTPTSGTSVFSPIASSAAAGTVLTTGFPVDAQINAARTLPLNRQAVDRLRGISSTSTASSAVLLPSSGNAEVSSTSALFWDNTGFQMTSPWSGNSTVFYNFRRAPGFFDVVCYTGTGANRTVSHNLGVAPELMIVKRRNGAAEDWYVYHSAMGSGNFINLDLTAALTSSNQAWNNTSPTSSVFSLGNLGGVNSNTNTFVAYLFATVAGVSKVGSYTGTAALQTIDCGFSAGARFVLIKRTDSTGDWYVWDSARGISSGNDPYLLLNSATAEVTGTNYVDTTSVGFQVTAAAPTGINASGGSYIFLAIA